MKQVTSFFTKSMIWSQQSAREVYCNLKCKDLHLTCFPHTKNMLWLQTLWKIAYESYGLFLWYFYGALVSFSMHESFGPSFTGKNDQYILWMSLFFLVPCKTKVIQDWSCTSLWIISNTCLSLSVTLDEYKMKGVEEVKYMRGEEDRVNARNQENLVRFKTRMGNCFLFSDACHIFSLYLHSICLRHMCLFLAYSERSKTKCM